MKSVKDQFRNNIWLRVWRQIGKHVGSDVNDRVRSQTEYQIWDEIFIQLGRPIMRSRFREFS